MAKRFTTAGAMVAMTAVSGNYFIGLGTDESASGLVGEAKGQGYERQSVSIVAVGATGVNADAVTFAPFSPTVPSLTHAGLFTADTGGTCIWVGALATAITPVSGQPATLVAGCVSVEIATLGTPGVAGGAPVNSSLPAIAGTAQVWQTLTASAGTWSGTAPILHAYQWQRGGIAIAGATAGSYTVQPADAGATLRVVVTATNGAGSAQAASAGTATVPAATEIAYRAGLFDFCADDASVIATPNGPVSALASRQGFPATFVQATPANQPSHAQASKWISFAAAASDDANGDFLSSTTIRDRYRSSPNALGVFYVMFRAAQLPAWNSMVVRVGAASGLYTNFLLRGYGLRMMSTGQLWLGRGGNTTNENRVATLSGAFNANEWIAAALVLNDSRASGVTNGASDLVTRLFAKTKPLGTHPSLTSGVTLPQSVPVDPSVVCEVGRAQYGASTADSHFNGLRLHTLGFDAEPPITNAAIEAVLDSMLARV